MNRSDTRLEPVVFGGCVFLSGYALLLAALFADSPFLLLVGTTVLLLGFFFIGRLDQRVQKSCATSGLVHIMLIGFIAACLFWDADLIVRLLVVLLSPIGLAIVMFSLRMGGEAIKVTDYIGKAYREIRKQDERSLYAGRNKQKKSVDPRDQ
jgi:hypothetical protein